VDPYPVPDRVIERKERVMTYVTAAVLLPEERVTEFYGAFAQWLDGAPSLGDHPASASAELRHWTGSEEDLEAAGAIWKKLTPKAKALFARLIRTPDQPHTAAELAAALDIPHGFYGVAGVLAWPGRYAAAEGYHFPVQWMPGEAGEGASYWMTEVVASSFLPHVEPDDL